MKWIVILDNRLLYGPFDTARHADEHVEHLSNHPEIGKPVKVSLAEASAAPALVDALLATRAMIDVSTIRPGKKNEQRWGDLKDRIDHALFLTQ